MSSVDDIYNRIDQLRRCAETGEEWAHICALEAQAIRIKQCHRCHGTGVVTITIHPGGLEVDADDQICPYCQEAL